MTSISLGAGVYLHPADMQSTNVLAYGAPGAGKTTILRLICERAPARFQQILIDTEDELATLRISGREYTILGGEDADVAGLEDMDWEELGAIVHKMGSNFIFQIGEWSINRQREFVGAFVIGLLRTPRDLWRPMIFGLDESDVFAPNGASFASTDPLVNLSKRGRKRGWTCVFATQRMSLLSADLRGMCSNLAIGLANQTLDVKAAAAMIGVGPTSAEARGFKTLKRGDFWVYGPAFGGGEPALVHFERSLSRSPEPGTKTPPARSNKAVVRALSKLVKPPEKEEAKPATAGAAPAQVVFKTDPAVIEAATKHALEHMAVQVAAKLRGFADKLVDGKVKIEPVHTIHMDGVTPPQPAERVARSHLNGHSPAPDPEGLAPRHIKMLDGLRLWETMGVSEPTREQTAAVAGLSHRTGNFSNMLTVLRTHGAIETPTGRVVLTAAGRSLSSPPAPDMTIRAMVDGIVEPRHSRALDALPKSGQAITREEFAQRLGLSERTGNFSNLLTFLRTRGLITTPTGRVAVEPWIWSR